MTLPDAEAIQVPGYELGKEIGRGGMGVVYTAREPSLGRDVAIKLLAAHLRVETHAAARFRTEARITGQLQHPGIPAVHELGVLPDGRPFLAMKLVQGQTLEKMLADHCDLNENRGRFIAIFEQVCQAVGFAHANRVLHRDLKPANIMVGAHGEVQVMDWGLAKLLDEKVHDEETSSEDDQTTLAYDANAIDTSRFRDSATKTGAILGTLSYMPPEQAGGEIRKLDPRSDVFGLGAILCQILTGQPPYCGKNINENRVKAVRGDLVEAFTRVDASKAEPDLIALCKKCLSFRQEDRPADGQALAAEVQRIRTQAESRARTAELERSAALISAAESQKRRKQFLIASILIVALLVLGILGTSIGLARSNALAKAERTAKQAALASAELERQSTQHAKAMTKLALDTNNDMVFALQEELRNRPETHELRKQLLERARIGLAKFIKEAGKTARADHALLITYMRMGDLELSLGNSDAAQKEYETGHQMAQQLLKAAPDNATAQRDHSFVCEKLGDFAQQLGKAHVALERYQEMLTTNELLAMRQPQSSGAQRDLSLGYEKVGDITLQLGKSKEAMEWFEKSLKINLSFAERTPKDLQSQRDLSVSYNKMGDLHRQSGRPQAAIEFYKKMLAILQSLAEEDPTSLLAQRDLFIANNKLGDMALQLGNPKEAVSFYEKSLASRKKLAEADPRNATAQRDLVVGYKGLGDVKLQLGATNDAKELYQNCLAVTKALVEADPLNAAIKRDLGIGYNGLGNVALQLGQIQEALEQYENGLAVRLQLAEMNPKNVVTQRDVAGSYEKIATAYEKIFDFKRATEAYAKAVTVTERYGQSGSFAEDGPFFRKKKAACEEFDLATTELEFAFSQPVEKVANLLMVRLRALLYRQQTDAAIATAERFASWVETLAKDQSIQRYNAACAFALCVNNKAPDEALIDKALALLEKVKSDGYFGAQQIAHFKKDTDFDSIRNHAKFAQFIAHVVQQ